MGIIARACIWAPMARLTGVSVLAHAESKRATVASSPWRRVVRSFIVVLVESRRWCLFLYYKATFISSAPIRSLGPSVHCWTA
jgi:hypothetical protein